jgi:hypothetical protein
LISPANEILLLHRVQTSSSFPSAHVFPGGNLSLSQDGEIPAPNDPRRHIDGPAYRLGAIRECFEESGILLAKKNDGSNSLLEVEEAERERARKEIHAGKLKFREWVKQQGGVVDTGRATYVCYEIETDASNRSTTTLHPLDNAYQSSKTLHDPNVYIFPTPHPNLRQHILQNRNTSPYF